MLMFNISVDNFFNFLNLLLRIALILFFTYKYIAPYILKALEFEKKQKQEQDQHRILAIKACSQIQQKIQEQDVFFTDLYKKFNQWQKHVLFLQKEQQILCQKQEQKIQVSMLMKQKHLQQNLLVKETMPELLEQTKASLIQKFQNDNKLHKSYIAKIVQSLDEKII